MVDSGNIWRNAISETLMNQLGFDQRDLRPIPGVNTVNTAGKGQKLEVLGELRTPLKIRLGGHPRLFKTRPAVIRGLQMDLNISGPFLKEQGIDQLHTQNALLVDNKIIPLSDNKTSSTASAAPAAAYVAETVTLEPYQLAYVAMRLPERIKQRLGTAVGVLQGDERFAEKTQLHPWRAAVVECSAHGRVKAGILNLQDEPVTIARGTRYGDFIEADVIDELDKEPPLVLDDSPTVELPPTGKRKRKADTFPGDDTPAAKKSLMKHSLSERKRKAEPSTQKGTRLEKRAKLEPDASISKLNRSNRKRKTATGPEPAAPAAKKLAKSPPPVKAGDFKSGPTTEANQAERIRFLIRVFQLSTSNCPELAEKRNLAQAVAVLLKHWERFSWDGKVGTTDLVTHRIPLKSGAEPVNVRYRPINPAYEEELAKQIQEWLDDDIIEPSNSPYNFPLVPVRKKDGSIRFCLDFR